MFKWIFVIKLHRFVENSTFCLRPPAEALGFSFPIKTGLCWTFLMTKARQLQSDLWGNGTNIWQGGVVTNLGEGSVPQHHKGLICRLAIFLKSGAKTRNKGWTTDTDYCQIRLVKWVFWGFFLQCGDLYNLVSFDHNVNKIAGHAALLAAANFTSSLTGPSIAVTLS